MVAGAGIAVAAHCGAERGHADSYRYFAEEGIIQVRYLPPGESVDRYFAIDAVNDPTCQQDPALRKLIQHVIEAGSGE